jgi:hypothetical protein
MKRVSNFMVAFAAIAIAIVMTASSTGAQSKETKSANVTGNWKITLETPNGPGTPSVTFKQEGDALTGTYKGRMGEAPLKGTVKGNEINFSIKVNAQGNELQIDYSGTVDGDTMKGKVKFGEFGEGTFSGKKE